VGTESGTIAAPANAPITTTPTTPPKASPTHDNVTGTNDTVTSTASVGSVLSVAVGASNTISITFTSSDGKLISGFALSGSLNSLPAGWSGPSGFTCAAVAPGNSCVLTLTYAPIAVDSGTLTLNCVFVDNSMTPRTPGACLTLNYVATIANNVVATPSIAGEVDAVEGAGAEVLNVNFTTDDGNPATALTLTTDLTSLPAGWSSPAMSLNCPIVRVGNGCQVPLRFAPASAAGATLTLNYSYVDGSGAARTGAVNIPYAGVTNGTVVGTASPAGQINAIETTGSTAVAVTFNTTDGKSAANLALMTDLSTLPPGWSSTSSALGCATVGTGNGCQLQLRYAPTALTSGTLSLRYGYIDESGMANTGLVNIGYAATTDDNVLYTPSTVGELNAIVGSSQTVVLTFTTDDSRAATSLGITGSLTALPPGWSSSVPAFDCTVVESGTACQLSLSYAPTMDDSGTLSLGYSYLNNAGEAKTGTVSIPYRATANDNLVATANPTPVAATVGSNNTVTVTFTTDDGNLATALSVDLSTLPAGWSSASSAFICASFGAGGGCTLSMTYMPAAAVNSTLSFGVSYINNAGTPKTMTVSIPYTATP
jgi:hypothetical protein